MGIYSNVPGFRGGEKESHRLDMLRSRPGNEDLVIILSHERLHNLGLWLLDGVFSTLG